jgi:hypothetical protein
VSECVTVSISGSVSGDLGGRGFDPGCLIAGGTER